MWEFQSPDSRKVQRRGVRLRTGWRERRRRKRFREDARREVKSVPNLSPVMYSIISRGSLAGVPIRCFPGRGGIAQAGKSLMRELCK